TGWFPEAYVKPIDSDLIPRSSGLRSAHSTNDLLDVSDEFPQPDYRQGALDQRSIGKTANPAAPPAPPLNNSVKKSERGVMRAELFPKGTNPFATVKLRPTVTNDRSAPLIR
ncbi:hypothetical protein GDO81_018109, partial [Engystomops pustulosus]